MDDYRYDPSNKMVYLFIGNLEKRNRHGIVKPKACQDLMQRLLTAMDTLFGFRFSNFFAVIPSREILTFGRTNG